MIGTNPAWVVVICGDDDILGACLSARAIRKNSAESLIAFVKDGSVMEESKEQLHEAFDLVTFAPKEPTKIVKNVGSGRDILLLQCLNLVAFSSIVVLQPGVLVFCSFRDVLEQRNTILKTNYKGNNWKIVGFSPNREKYLQTLQILENGHTFDVEFIQNEIISDCLRDSGTIRVDDEVVLSWSELACYAGDKTPFVEINSDLIINNLHEGKLEFAESEAEGFWQKAIIKELDYANLRHPQLFSQDEKSWVAVVGMACRFPGANSVDEYWQVLTSGLNKASAPPSNRLGKHALCPEVRANFLKCPIDEFDAGFFGIPPSEAAITDPQARLLLEVSWEAFEDAGFDPEKLRNKPVGVFYGSWMQEYRDLLHNTENGFLRKYIANAFGCTAAKLSFFYGFTGPNIATESGCSSSMVAVEMACENLKNGKCPVALAAGTNIILQMDPKAKVVWAEDGICKTFDASANGYGRGEGVAVLVLKRYSDALRDSDKIHGIIRGSASSQEGLSKSFGTPTVESEVNAMEKAMKAAGIQPKDVDYVEAHATGTAVGDPIEAEAIVRAYSSFDEKTTRKSPLWIGSGKTVIGHTESCSGIAGIIKVLLAMKHETIPPHINLNSINPKVDFSSIPGNIPLESQSWKRSTRPRIAGVSNFGITGTDVHLILQESPETLGNHAKVSGNAPLQILTLSAKSQLALKQLSQSFCTFLDENEEDTLENISYTASACRPHHSFRTAILGTNKAEMLLQLNNQNFTNVTESEKRVKVGYICQDGTNYDQYLQLYSSFPVFQMYMDACDTTCREVTGYSPLKHLLNRQNIDNFSTAHLQCLALSISYSFFKLWESWGVKADHVVGVKKFGTLIGAVVAGQTTLQKGFKIIMDDITAFEMGQNGFSSKIHLVSYKNKEEFETEKASELECTTFIELLPNENKEKNSAIYHLFATLASLYKAGCAINWEGFYGHFRGLKKVSLPHYPFQRKSYWFEKGEPAPLQNSISPQFWKQIHPLLGNYIPSSSNESESHTFENVLIAQQLAPYLCDHKIGTEMIFPAAAHLELLLAANHFQGLTQQGVPHILENFQVHLPLHLEATLGKRLQTVMIKTGESGAKWSIFVEGKENTALNSKIYASGLVTTQQGTEFCILHAIEEIKKRTVLDETLHLKIYSKFANFGLKFGKEFQSLQNIWQSAETGETLVTVSIPEDSVHYICHPTLSDAMIQCYMFAKFPTASALHVPVKIERFIVYRRISPQECATRSNLHVYFNSSESNDTVFLVDSGGSTVALISGIELRPTTVGSILNAAGVSRKVDDENRPVDTYEVIWKPAVSFQTEDSLELSPSSADFTKVPDFLSLLESLEQQNRFTRKEKELQADLKRLCELYVLKAMYEMGWVPKLNQQVNFEQVATQFQIVHPLRHAFHQYIGYLVENGVLEKHTDDVFIIKTLPENLKTVEESITNLLTNSLSNYGPIHVLTSCGSQLAPILQGKVNGQQLLFESENSDNFTPAEIYYQLNLYNRSAGSAASNTFIEIAKHLINSSSKGTLRILEVGGRAGSGFFVSEALSLLEEEGIPFSYYFTEMSPTLLKRAEKRLGNRVVYKALDIDVDPLSQGFPPGYFDVVVGMDALHFTKELKKSVEHMKMLLKEGGALIIAETNHNIKEADIIFGSLEGYWGYNDHDVRQKYSGDDWVNLFEGNGLNEPISKIMLADNNLAIVVGTKRSQLNNHLESGKTWLFLHDLEQNSQRFERIFKKMQEVGRNVISFTVDNFLQTISEKGDLANYIQEGDLNIEGFLCVFESKDDSLAASNCQRLLEPLLLVSKHLASHRSREMPKLFVATFGVWRVDEKSLAECPTSAPAWGFVRCVMTEIIGLTSKLIDMDPTEETLGESLDAIMQEIWIGDGEKEIIYRNGVRYARRLNRALEITSKELNIPIETKDFTVKLSQSNLLSDLSYVPKQIGNVGENQVVVEVRATSLNFKDVLNVMKPSEDFKDNNTIGLDFSGVVTSVGHGVTNFSIGTPVFGMSLAQSTISGYITVSAQQLAEVPSNLTFAEAATLPVAFLTAWYCLVDIAQVKKGQTVLIHAASGGVGLIAIQIAKHLGLKIIATAGSNKKRKYLANMGVQHVLNSRTLEYGQKIKEITNSQGVDVVLNCLTGPGFKETSLEICKDGGYFVEISKLDIWQPEEVKKRKPGVNYEIVDLTTVDPITINVLWNTLSTLLKSGSIQPLPFRRYTASRLVEALKYLQKAKHIGKIIMEMPKYIPETSSWEHFLFNDRSTYLITGGKGDIGLAIAEWMVKQGAKYLVLLGRGQAKPKVLETIKKLEEKGAKIMCKEVDVADLTQLRNVIEEIHRDLTLPPIRGVQHCAGVLSDGMIVNQNWEKFDFVLNPKVKGTYNLHILTLDCPLEFFVVHSSMTCTLGNAGQSNYAAANAYMEALIEKRSALGLPALSLSWGQWNAGLAENMEIGQFNPFTISQGVAALQRFFIENRVSVAAGFLNLGAVLNLAPYYEKTLLQDVLAESKVENNAGGRGEAAKMNLQQVYSRADQDEEKEQVIRDFIKEGLSETLGIPLQELKDDVEFANMGMDSLLGIEFYNRLQSEMGDVDLGYVDMEKDGTVEKIGVIIRTALNTMSA